MIYKVPVKFIWVGDARIEANSPEEAKEIAKTLNPNEIGWEGKTTTEIDGEVSEWTAYKPAFTRAHSITMLSLLFFLSSCSVFKQYLCDHNYGDDKYYRELRDQKAANCYKRMGLIP